MISAGDVVDSVPVTIPPLRQRPEKKRTVFISCVNIRQKRGKPSCELERATRGVERAYGHELWLISFCSGQGVQRLRMNGRRAAALIVEYFPAERKQYHLRLSKLNRICISFDDLDLSVQTCRGWI